jgi:group I intron endonuclease
MRSAGIYQIENQINGKLYVGSAINLQRRWLEHRSGLRRGVHGSPKLQNAWNKYGEENFVFRPLLVCTPADVLMYEQRAIDTYRPAYNTCPTAGNSFGVKHTAEARARMSAANKGKKLSPEHIAAIVAGTKGKKRSTETKARQRVAATGRVQSEETKRKLSEMNSGKVMPDETKKKISAKLKGVAKPPRTEQHSQRISDANKGRGLGGKKSPETIAKMRVAARARVDAKRGVI